MWTTLFLWLTSPLTVALGTTGLIGAGLIAVALLAPTFLPVPRMYLIGAGVACLCAGAAYWWVFDAGMEHQAQLTAAKDKAAIARNTKAQTKVDACNDGVDWDVTTGTCISR